MAKKAIAYVSDVIIGRTGEVISRGFQKEAISKYAAEKGIEVVAWFEDSAYNEELMARPGIKAMMAYAGEYDAVVVERVWSLARKVSNLENLFRTLERKKVKLEAATLLWDCVSQQVRRRFEPGLARPHLGRPIAVREEGEKVPVRKPERVRFPSMSPVPA